MCSGTGPDDVALTLHSRLHLPVAMRDMHTLHTGATSNRNNESTRFRSRPAEQVGHPVSLCALTIQEASRVDLGGFMGLRWNIEFLTPLFARLRDAGSGITNIAELRTRQANRPSDQITAD